MELLTMAQAIARCVEMGGGEVIGSISGVICAHITPDFGLEQCLKADIERAGIEKVYTVRPLPPVTFGWPEALERLQRGESVKYTDEEIEDMSEVVVKPYMRITEGNVGVISIDRLKDKQFTEV